MRKVYTLFIFSIFHLFVKAQFPYMNTGLVDGIGQYGYLEKDAVTFMSFNSNTYGNIYQLFGRTFLNGNNILTYGTAINTCGSGVNQNTNNYNFGANAIAGLIAYTSVHADYCLGGGNSYSNNPNQIGFNERQHYIFDVTDRPSDLSSNLLQLNAGGVSPNNVVMSVKIDFGSVSTRILNRFWIQSTGTLAEATEIANDGFKVYYENATGSETFNGNESFGTLYGDYNANATNNNIYGNDALGIPIPAGGLRVYVVLNKFASCISSAKTAQVSLINDGMDFTPAMNTSFTKARVNPIPAAPNTIAMFVRSVWGGALNTDWNNAGNWSCGGVPSAVTDVSIPASLPRYPIITGTVNARNIDIASGASVTVNTGGFFNLYGSITNAGSFDLTNGTLKLDGAVPLSIAGSSFVNATVKNLTIGTNASLSNELKVTGTVSFSTSTKTLTTNGNLTLVSNASGTADIANTTGNTITGEVSIERYLPAKKAWRYLATPVVIATSPTISNSWREGEPVGTNTATGYGTRITGPVNMDEYTLRSSMKSYNMATNAFVEINNAALANPIANEQGYFVFVRGDRGVDVPSNAVGATTLRIKGELRTGNQIFNVNADKFQSVGNPYPSAIDFRTVTKSAQIVDAFTVWNPNNAGSYNVGAYENYIYNLTSGHYEKTPGGTIRDSIQSGEAIFIQNGDLALNGSITIMETDKVGGSRLVSRGDDQSRPGVLNPTMEINLHARNTDGSNFLADGVKLNFDNSFSNTLDNMDVRKVNNSFDNLAIKSNGKNLVVERRSNLLLVDTIFLHLTNTRIAPYRFEIDPSVLGNLQLAAFLKDKFLQTETPVSLTAVTNYNFNITADAGSLAADRFMIVFRQPVGGPLPVRFIDIAATKNADKTNDLKWAVANEINIQQYQIERSDKGTNFVSIGNTMPLNNNGGNYAYHFVDAAPLAQDNYYRIKAISANGQIQYSAIVKILADVKDASIAVYPNPVEGKKMQIRFTNKMGKYSIMLISNEGKTVFAQSMVVSNANEIKVIELNRSLAKGKYELIIQSADAANQILPLLIQ